MSLKITLAEDWKRLHKCGTVIWSATLGVLSAAGPFIRDNVTALGPTLRQAWQAVPDDLKAIVPAHAQQAIAYAILFGSIIAVRYASVNRSKPEGDPQ